MAESNSDVKGEVPFEVYQRVTVRPRGSIWRRERPFVGISRDIDSIRSGAEESVQVAVFIWESVEAPVIGQLFSDLAAVRRA